jgi:hypothetical protein
MEYISITYKAKWCIKGKPNYKWTECKKLINTNTGRVIKKTLKGLTPGYWIGKDFYRLDKMKDMVEKIIYNKLPL